MAHERRPLTYEDFWDFRMVSDPRISPDGRRVAYTVTQLERESDKVRSAVWVKELDGGEERQLTAGTHSDHSPRWSPDGRFLAFVSNREADRPQIYVMGAHGGEGRRITNREEGAHTPVWSPDSTRLAFVVDMRSDEQRVQSEIDWKAEKEDERKDAVELRRLTKLKYRFDGRGYHDKRAHIFVVDLDGSNERQLTSGDVDDNEPAWSPDGTLIAFSSNRTANADRNFASDICVVDPAGGEPRRLTNGTLTAGTPAWLPDGSGLIFFGREEWIEFGPRNGHVWRVSRDGGDTRDLMPDWDATMAALLGDTGPGGATRPVSSPDGRWVYFTSTLGGSEALCRVSSEGGTPERVTENDLHVGSYDISPDGETLVICAATTDHPFDLWTVTAAGGTPEPLTETNRDLLDAVLIASTERFTYQSVDGWEMEGWLVRPPRDTGVPCPLVLLVHGGPHSTYGNTFYFNAQVLAGRGYACLYINPRGSSGYRLEFARAACRDWGGKPYEDLMRGVDHTVAMGGIDEARMAITGGSYGGYMTCWVLGHTERFACGVAVNPVTNLQSFWGTSDIGQLWCNAQMGGPWWDHPEHYREMSPLTHAPNVRTPLLFLHAENDNRVPIEQSEQMYAALQVLGVETEMVRIPKASHALTNAAPRHRIARWVLACDWFDRHL